MHDFLEYHRNPCHILVLFVYRERLTSIQAQSDLYDLWTYENPNACMVMGGYSISKDTTKWRNTFNMPLWLSQKPVDRKQVFVLSWVGMAIWLVSIWLVKSNINRGRYILASYFFKVKLVKISNGSDQLLVSFSQLNINFALIFRLKMAFPTKLIIYAELHGLTRSSFDWHILSYVSCLSHHWSHESNINILFHCLFQPWSGIILQNAY